VHAYIYLFIDRTKTGKGVKVMLTDLVRLIEGKPSVSDGVMERLNCCNLVWVSLINGMEYGLE